MTTFASCIPRVAARSARTACRQLCIGLVALSAACGHDVEPATAPEVALTDTTTKTPAPTPAPTGGTTTAQYTITQSVSDEAQRNTIAFDGLAFLTGSLGAQAFLPPGKVADYSGFQYLRDNDPTALGHNTDFVTIIATNMLSILSASQLDLLIVNARLEIQRINQFAYARYPFLDAFRRHFDGTAPTGMTLDSAAVVTGMASLYRLDGQISYNRAKLMGAVITSLSATQRAALDALKAKNGVGNWNRTLTDPLKALQLDRDVNVAVMTYASEMYAWYAGTAEADTYFCPERHGTYFGSFYLKDWPAMGNPNYTINEQLTATAGQRFLGIQTPTQAALVTGLVDLQRPALLEMVERRRDIATMLRRFQVGLPVDSAAVIALSERYGALDGMMAYWYATRFTAVARSLSEAQRAQVSALAAELGYVAPSGGFLYSEPIPMPSYGSTDWLFSRK